MRQLKFRAWNGHAMEYGGFTIHACGGVVGSSLSDVPDGCKEVMQFTGLLDKYGKEIYEGDIVQHINGWTGAIVWYQQDCAFISENVKEKTDTAWLAPGIQTIIGNVYKNPELIE